MAGNVGEGCRGPPPFSEFAEALWLVKDSVEHPVPEVLPIRDGAKPTGQLTAFLPRVGFSDLHLFVKLKAALKSLLPG